MGYQQIVDDDGRNQWIQVPYGGLAEIPGQEAPVAPSRSQNSVYLGFDENDAPLNKQPQQLPDGRWLIDPVVTPGLPVAWDQSVGGYVADAATYAQYSGNMQQWFDTQQSGPDIWSTVLPALVAAGIGGISAAGSLGGAAGAAGGAGEATAASGLGYLGTPAATGLDLGVSSLGTGLAQSITPALLSGGAPLAELGTLGGAALGSGTGALEALTAPSVIPENSPYWDMHASAGSPVTDAPVVDAPAASDYTPPPYQGDIPTPPPPATSPSIIDKIIETLTPGPTTPFTTAAQEALKTGGSGSPLLPDTLPSWATPGNAITAVGAGGTLASLLGGTGSEDSVNPLSTGINDAFNAGDGTASSLNTMTPTLQQQLLDLGYTPAQIAALGGNAANIGNLLGSANSPTGIMTSTGDVPEATTTTDTGAADDIGKTPKIPIPSGGDDGDTTEVPLTEQSWLDQLLTPKNLATLGLALGSAGLTSNAASKAAEAQIQAANIAAAQQKAMYDQTRADQEPWRTAGAGALSRLNSLISPGGDLARKFTAADLNSDPVYQSGLQFGLDQGTKGINQRAISGGMYDSGATLKALTQFGNDYGSTKGNEAYNRFNTDQTRQYNQLAGVAGTGQIATNQVQAANQALGNSQSGLTTDAGNARAASIVSGTNAWGNALGNVSSAINGSSSDKILRALLGNNYSALGIA